MSKQYREDIIALAADRPVGIELGVAEGVFSHKVLSKFDVEHWYSVDMWAGDRGHDVNQYKKAVSKLLAFRDKNTILKLTFDQALSLFPDEYFDVIYIDGYAHTGQDDGNTLRTWWPKLKPGGLFSGDDYDIKQWYKTVEQVDQFAKSVDKTVNVFNFVNHDNNNWCKHPSWYFYKD